MVEAKQVLLSIGPATLRAPTAAEITDIGPILQEVRRSDGGAGLWVSPTAMRSYVAACLAGVDFAAVTELADALALRDAMIGMIAD